MINLDYLNEYENKMKNYNYEIKKINRKIYEENKSNSTDSVSGSSSVYPYQQRHFKIEGVSNKEIERLEKRKKAFERRKTKLEKELRYKLDNLEDRQLADIIEQKYIDKREWKQIAMKLHYAGESGVRSYFNRYFEK